MDRLGPFEACPALAVAVSGGADSMALALLTRDWVAQHRGTMSGLVVDHGLRPESATEAALTIARLTAAGIPARLLRLSNLARGPALAERARMARYEILTQACRDTGVLHLLLGHHAADQAETLAMRVLRESGQLGLAGMAALRETTWVRLLRPLLTIQPSALRALLTERGIGWVEDPSNQDQRTLRARLRRRMAPASPDLIRALAWAGRRRALDEAAIAVALAERATLRPEGFARLTRGRIPVGALSALLRAVAGAHYPAAPRQVADLAAEPRAATLGGTRILQAGRLGHGFLVVREEAAMGGPVPAVPGAVWDSRFRLVAQQMPRPGTVIAGLGDAAAGLRSVSDLPAAVLRTLPALWRDGTAVAVPHIGYMTDDAPKVRFLFAPPVPVCGPDFVPTTSNDCNFRQLGEP